MVKNIVRTATIFMLAAALAFPAMAQEEGTAEEQLGYQPGAEEQAQIRAEQATDKGGRLTEEEWYDPTDWFDGDDVEYENPGEWEPAFDADQPYGVGEGYRYTDEPRQDPYAQADFPQSEEKYEYEGDYGQYGEEYMDADEEWEFFTWDWFDGENEFGNGFED